MQFILYLALINSKIIKEQFELGFPKEEESTSKGVMKVNLNPESTFKLGVWFPSAIEVYKKF